MGLFFDQDWFDERLAAIGQSRAALARAAGMSVDEVEMVFRDQRELVAAEVRAFARVLSVDPEEIASRSGAADIGGPSLGEAMASAPGRGPAPRPELLMAREAVTGIHERLDRLERLMELMIRKLDQR